MAKVFLLISLLFFVALSGCRSPTQQIPATAVESPAPLPNFEVFREDCEKTVHGRLFSSGGAVWFDNLPDDSSSAPSQDDQLCDLQEAEYRGSQTWDFSKTLVTTLPGPWSPLVPLTPGVPGGKVIAVKAHEQYGMIVPPDLRFVPLWTPGYPIHFVGKSGEFGVFLSEEQDDVRFVSIDGEGLVKARSEPVELQIDGIRGIISGLPTIAPLGETRFVLLCGREDLCVAEVQDDQINLHRTNLQAHFLTWSPTRGAMIEEDNEDAVQCRIFGSTPLSNWSSLPYVSCPDDRIDASQGDIGLPVDGMMFDRIPVEVGNCLVRNTIDLPDLLDDPQFEVQSASMRHSGAGIVVLNDNEYLQESIDLEMLVRGNQIAIGFTFLDGGGVPTVRRDFAVALPPGSVEARSTTFLDHAFWHVRISTDFPFPFEHPSSCWLGRLVIRVLWEPIHPYEQAFANRYYEFGRCE